MSNAIPYLIQGKNIILVIDGKSHTVSKDTHISYHKIIEALKNQDWDEIRDIIEPKKAIIDFGKGYVGIDGNTITWKGQPWNNSLSTRMIEMYLDGFPIDPMVRFMENLMENPSKRSVDQLYGFLEKNKLPITEDGYFLAYKKVRSNYMDIHSGTFDNSIGQVVEMERNGVDDDPNRTCSSGLHFCSEGYLPHFGNGPGNRVMIVKINPADVVSIPTDYDGAKGRCCRYEVVAEVNGDPKAAFQAAVEQKYSKPSAPVQPLKAKAAPAEKAKPLSPTAAWPFPVGSDYSVVRVNGGAVEASGLNLNQAREMVAKNARQKKAMLKILDLNGDTVV